jgi:hypothetical protein
MKAPAPGWQAALAFVLSLLFLCSLIGWLQNVHIITANGMYKSIQAEPWIADPAQARLDWANYLYFPLYGASARLLDALGILRGVPWKQFAYLNAFWASLGVAAVYAFVLRLAGDWRIAAFAALFHLGCGFVLLLAVINEDIMPGYVLVLASMLMAGLWFDRPTVGRVIVVGALFTLGWLVEWRLIFPTLPALLLALAIAGLPLSRRAGLIVVLLVTVVATTWIVKLLWWEHAGYAHYLTDLLWTGKGVDTGWGGLDWGKRWMMLGGVGGYLVALGTMATPDTAQHFVLPLTLLVLAELAIFLACVAAWWKHRGDPRLRAIAVVFLGTLAAGEVLNLYSQPHDPQMQVNVMAWLTVAWALLLWRARSHRAVFATLAVLSFTPIILNTASFARFRGEDARAVAALAMIEQHLPPDRTVFVYWGFEPITMWQYALWSRTWDWDGTPNDAKFKWIALDAGAIRHTRWTPEQNADVLRRDLEAAFDRGYKVVIGDVWTWSEARLASSLAALSAPDRAPAIHAMLHGRYEATPVVEVPTVGTYYELRRR